MTYLPSVENILSRKYWRNFITVDSNILIIIKAMSDEMNAS